MRSTIARIAACGAALALAATGCDGTTDDATGSTGGGPGAPADVTGDAGGTAALDAVGTDAGTTSEPVDPSVTWTGGVSDLLGEQCAGCHTDGGIGPFPLDEYESAQKYGAAALAAVEAGRMPPWMPDPDCREYQEQRILTPAEKATLRGWVEAGTPKGAELAAPTDRGSARTGGPSLLGEPTLRIAPADAYTPNPEKPDDYRCFVLDHTFPKETYLVASQVHPDQQAIVHHVLLFLVKQEMTGVATALDDAEEGPGYTCFGGPGVSAETIGAWVPGSVPISMPEDTAIRLPEGSRIVMQIHYNVLAKGPVPDQSSLDLWLQDEQPTWLMSIDPLPHTGIDIAAGDPESVQTRVFTNKGSKPWTIVGTAPHMHMLGKRISATVVHEGGAEECLVDIPDWDFNWQQTYRFLPGQDVLVQPGDSIRLECVYDNSAANQPVVNGVKQTPGNVKWGEGTLDEMCLNYIMTVEPFAPLPPPPTNLCGGFDACYDACRGGDGATAGLTACTLLCGSQSGSGCTQCIVQGLLGCTTGSCGSETSALIQCLTGCQGSPDFGVCLFEECGETITTFDECADPVVDAGTCDAPLAGCGASLAR